MISVNIICLGKLKENYLREAVAEYTKRLQAFCKISVTELTPVRLDDNPSQEQINNALKSEAEMIKKCINPRASVYALCIEGKELTSEELSASIQNTALGGCAEIDFIIGSSYGLHPEIKKSADVRLSMSRMTFPHQLARVLLLEQIYRAFMISSGGKYHK